MIIFEINDELHLGKNYILIIGFLFSQLVNAAGNRFPIGARAVALGNAVAANEDVSSVFNNIAGIAKLDRVNMSAFFESRYNFSAFNQYAIVGNLPLASTPLKYGNIGIGVFRLGNELYNETRANVGFAHNIKGVNLGIQAEYIQIAISEWGSKGNIAINFGGQVQVLPNLKFGAHIYNINQAKIATYQDERIPTIMKLGVSFKPAKRLSLNAEIEKDVMLPTRFKAGVEYGLLDKLYFRTGINTNPVKYFFGFSFLTKSMALGYAMSVHEQLGLSHAISIAYLFKAGKNATQTSPME